MQYGLQIKSYYNLNSQNQVKFSMYIRPVFPGPVTYNCGYQYLYTQKVETNNYLDDSQMKMQPMHKLHIQCVHFKGEQFYNLQ